MLCRCLVQMSLWTAGIVVMTLLINAPLIPVLLKWTGLSQVTPVKAKIRAKAARAFTRYTHNAVKELKNDEDEMLRGTGSCFFFCHTPSLADPLLLLLLGCLNDGSITWKLHWRYEKLISDCPR